MICGQRENHVVHKSSIQASDGGEGVSKDLHKTS